MEENTKVLKSIQHKSIEIDRLSCELKNINEQKLWAERQVQKLEKQLKSKIAVTTEKDRTAYDERRKIRELEQKIKSEALVSQHQLKKYASTLKLRDAKIDELNAALRNSPKRKAPLITSSVTKPMFTKMYENGILSMENIRPQDMQKKAEGYTMEAVLQDHESDKKRVQAIANKLSYLVGRELTGDPLTHLEGITRDIMDRFDGCVSIEEFNQQKEQIATLEKNLKVADTQWQQSEQRLEEILSFQRQALGKGGERS